ncbi:MAG: DUF192 domain-containing protein [Acidimicrobiia bacterium]
MTRTRAVAIGLLFAGVVGIAVAVVLFARDDGDGSSTPVSSSSLVIGAKPASAPFVGLTATQVAVGGRCLRVVVADDLAERVQGLRQRRGLGPYDGMLFVFDGPTVTGFTMSAVPVPLDIGFYAADGTPVSRRHMKPCPDAEPVCPLYEAGAPFTDALETLRGKLPSGALSGCN